MWCLIKGRPFYGTDVPCRIVSGCHPFKMRPFTRKLATTLSRAFTPDVDQLEEESGTNISSQQNSVYTAVISCVVSY